MKFDESVPPLLLNGSRSFDFLRQRAQSPKAGLIISGTRTEPQTFMQAVIDVFPYIYMMTVRFPQAIR